MRSLIRKASLIFVGGLTVALLAMVPSDASGKPRPGAKSKSGFRLFASILAGLTGNRVYCGINAAKGHICVDTLGSSVVAGGFWPKGTIDQYPFNSGIQVVGLIDPSNPANPWAGDTAGGFFYDPKGFTENGSLVFPVYNSANPSDAGNWPAPAFVPTPPDPGADLFDPALQGKVKASDNDVWFMTWEGDPASNAGRPHPLGIAVETRGMAFNTPTGNEDILYFIYTFYNVTTTDPAAYGNVRVPMRDTLIGLARRFQALNAAKFGVQLPATGYAINDMFVIFGADMDVGDADLDFASVNLPFNLGYAYQHNFGQPSGWVFDPGIFSDPFFPGVGFVGVKYLKSPIDPNTGQEVGLKLYSNTSRSVAFQDANDIFQLYRYASGKISTAAGDEACNTGDPLVTKICFINRTAPADMRFFQSSGPLTIPPGGSGSVVVAYVFAAPLKTGSCPGPATCSLTPDDPTRLSSISALATGANRIDSVTGYAGFLGDVNANSRVDQEEIQTVPQSLLGKSILAQTVFNNKFLQPAPPDAPDFFLVPGDNQVTVLWRQSATETAGDPYFAAASGVTLYDPNYRQFDVEGYRVYRGRSSSPNDLVLIAQFDYADRTFIDSTGQVNRVNPDRTTLCAPEIGVLIGTEEIPCDTTGVGTLNGVRRIIPTEFPITSPFVQVPTGQSRLLADSTAFVVQSDTASAGSATARALGVTDPALLQLRQSGVPFVYVDNDPAVRNGIRLFYAVATFDINSIRSGPSSLESARIAKPVTPQRTPANQNLAGELGTVAFTGAPAPGGGAPTPLDTTRAMPTLDPVTGTFSGPFPPANNWEFGLGTFVTAVLTQPGQVKVTLDSIQLGSAWDGLPASYWYSATSSTLPTTTFSLPIVQDATDVPGSNERNFPAIQTDAALTARFDPTVASQTFTIPGRLEQGLVGNYYTSAYGRGCINGAEGFADAAGCDYNGPRWFDGPSPQTNETQADPNAGNSHNNALPTPPTNFNNAGALTGVAVINHPLSYQTEENLYRQVEGAMGAAQRAADFNVHWGAGGLVDSVVDITHNVQVPFAADHIGGTWGFLNQGATTAPGSFDARPTVLTLTDFGCVPPLNAFATVGGAGGIIQCTGAVYQLSQTAVPGAIAHFSPVADAQTHAVASGPGFAMYLAGNLFMFELPPAGTVPAAGTVWTMRSYIGAIQGGKGGEGGDLGPYQFTPVARTNSAVGTSFTVDYSVTNEFVATTAGNLEQVHPVPDPYYVTNAFEQSTENKIIKFVNIPTDAIIRIYSLSGVLVRVLEHHSVASSEEVWDVRNRNGQVVSSGVYFFHIEAGAARRVGRMTVVNFAQ
jgi:hypothetical protein